MKISESLTILEQRILCHQLPNSFNSITTDDSNEEQQQQNVNKQNKIIQDLKRQILNIELEEYEMRIQHYDYLYEQELTALESKTSKINLPYQMCHFDMLMYLVKTYVYHHTNLMIRQIRYKESYCHIKLLRHYYRRRRHLLTTKKTIDVYPQIIIDIPKVSLSPMQLDYLSRNGKLRMILFNSSLKHEISFQDPIISDQIKVIFIHINVDKNN